MSFRTKLHLIWGKGAFGNECIFSPGKSRRPQPWKQGMLLSLSLPGWEPCTAPQLKLLLLFFSSVLAGCSRWLNVSRGWLAALCSHCHKLRPRLAAPPAPVPVAPRAGQQAKFRDYLLGGDKVRRTPRSVQAARRAVTLLLEIIVCLVVRRFLLPSAFPAKAHGSSCGLCMILGSCPCEKGPCSFHGVPSPMVGMERCQHRAGQGALGCFGAPNVTPPLALPKNLDGFGLW